MATYFKRGRNAPTNQFVIDKLTVWFGLYGIPEHLSTDGGIPFRGQAIESFLDRWNIDWRTSSVDNPQSNGRAELAVKVAKQICGHKSLSYEKLNCSLLIYRNTAQKRLGESPAQILFGENLPDGLPNQKTLGGWSESFAQRHAKRKVKADLYDKEIESRVNGNIKNIKAFPEIPVGNWVLVWTEKMVKVPLIELQKSLR